MTFAGAFDKDFVWGTATASYQIEGGHQSDGRGMGVWDLFCTKPGAIWESHTGNDACDHYHRLEEDLDLIAELGVAAYRFGVSWPRVLPHGVGRVNDPGMAFYERMVDGLLRRNITPYLTLFHWDYPQELERQGGWRNEKSPEWFAEFTTRVVNRLGDRVKHWFTLNEPHAFIDGGLREGRHAPGLRLPHTDILRAGHNALKAHGLATQIIRAHVKDSWVAMAPVLICAEPASDSPEDLEAARKYTFGMYGTDLRVSSWWMDPAFGRGYPEDGARIFGPDQMPNAPASDFDLIAQPLDAVGFNLYDARLVRAGKEGEPELVARNPGAPRTAFNWPVTPEGHFYGPKFAFERYGKPICITENGLSNRDWVDRNGEVHDSQRIDFIESHLSELSRAGKSGIDLHGYFHWSLMDNFEWNHGYRERFGLIHVDYTTFKRTKKQSFYRYRDIMVEARG